MGVYDAKCIKYEPTLSSYSHRTYSIEHTPYVIVSILKLYGENRGKLTKFFSTRKIACNYVGNIWGMLDHSIPLSSILNELPNELQTELIFELENFLEK